ncbi:MAG: hypothetical protein ABEJ23_03490 [Haloarculaceae archaeon]
MDERERARPPRAAGLASVARVIGLRRWALGSFHAALVLVVALLAGYRSGGLADALGAGGTVVGGGLYLLLLASTVATVRMLPDDLDARRGIRGTLATVGWGAVGGGLNGILFLLELAAVAVVGLLLVRPERLAGLPFVLVVGLPAAAVAGVAVGLAVALVDLLLVRIVDRLVPGERRERL